MSTPSTKPKTDAQKATRTIQDTIEFTKDEAEHWKVPPQAKIQRDFRANHKVKALAEAIAADGGVIPGVITFAVMKSEKYLLDGLQRRGAFLMSGKERGYADTRTIFVDSFGEMGMEFYRLNSHLVNMRPDDNLRALEEALHPLRDIRKACPFVGYDQVRRGERAPILSMSCLLRCWDGSASEVPGCVSRSSVDLAQVLTQEDADCIKRFLDLAIKAWGRDPEYGRLWTSINMTLCMWLYRRLVLTTYSAKTPRITDDQFSNCLMALSADPSYTDWLVGRHLGEHDRAPAYHRIKTIFSNRLSHDTGKKVMLPAPAWSHGGKVR